jgi:hypothetical protein
VNELFAFNPTLVKQHGEECNEAGQIIGISKDGKALFVEALKLDEIEIFLMEENLVEDLDMQHLQQLLTVLKDRMSLKSSTNKATYTALISTLLGGRLVGNDQEVSLALQWLCYSLARAVLKHLCEVRFQQLYNRRSRHTLANKDAEEAQLWLSQQEPEIDNKLEQLINTFDDIGESSLKHICANWQSAKSWDHALHLYYLRTMAQVTEATLERSPNSKGEKSEYEATIEALSSRGKEVISDCLKDCFTAIDSTLEDQFRQQSRSNMTWRKLFLTRDGYIGLAPKWAEQGDTIMLVRGARVPYVFTSVKEELQAQERSIRDKLDSTENDYHTFIGEYNNGGITDEAKMKMSGLDKFLMTRVYKKKIERFHEGGIKRTDKERQDLQRKLNLISRSTIPLDAWVLKGEAYIGSIMCDSRKKYSEVGGNAQRIMIV